MGEIKSEVAPGCPLFSAQQVAEAFVQQYYNILCASPEEVHKFYKDYSTMARPGSEGVIITCTTMEGINNAVMSSSYKGFDHIVENVHAQDSVLGSVLVGVIGTLTDEDNIKRKFAQTFFLAPQDTGGFYVRNDFLQFLDVVAPKASLPGSPEVPEPVSVPEPPSALSPKKSEVTDALNGEEETVSVPDPTPMEAFEILKKLGNPASPKKIRESPVKNSVGNVEEDSLKKVSYASVLAKEAPLLASAQVSLPPVAGLSKAGPPAPAKAAPTLLSSAPVINDGLAAEAPIGIYIKDLPANMKQEALLEEVKKFGAVRPNSIHIREYPEDGYRFAFVEFESAKSARSAVEAGEIWINGWRFEVQYKRSTNQGGSNQGRSMHGRGGYRSDNPGSRDREGRGGRDGEARGSSTAAKRNNGLTVRV